MGKEKEKEQEEKTAPKEIPTPQNLADYTGDVARLTQDQMLGQGGGVIFYEITDADGSAIEHVAMPCLLRDRPRVKAAMRKHAMSSQDMAKKLSVVSLKDMEDTEKLGEELTRLEEEDTDALLTLAYYSFKRTDPTLKDCDEAAGKKKIEQWMDEKQLRDVLNIALGLNRFEIPRMGAV